MKSIRIWLLVLLTALLPVRAALAVGMFCPVGDGAVGLQTQMHAGGHEHSAQHVDEAHEHAPQGTAGHHHGAADLKCCSVFAMPNAATPIMPSQPPALAFPDTYPAVPSLVLEGPERPPRSI